MKKSFRQLRQQAHALATSQRGRNALTFIVFLVISAVFWLIVALNNEATREFEVPLKINNIPSDVTILSDVPSKISVDIKDKGTSLLRWEWGQTPVIKLDYNQFRFNGRHLSMNNTQLSGIVRSAFGGATNVVEIKPDSLFLSYTTHPGVMKPIVLNESVGTSPQHIISGPIRMSADSVKVFSASTVPAELKVRTDSILLSGLTDTTWVYADLVAPGGTKLVPERVRVMIPVEPLVVKKKTVPIEVVDAPDTSRVITFPSSIEISYAVPMSLFNKEDHQIKALARYSPDFRKLPLTLINVPKTYRNATLTADSVEFLMEFK